VSQDVSGFSSTRSASSVTTTQARDEVAGVGQSVKQAGSEVAGAATGQVREVAEEAGRQARDLLDEARGQIRDQARSGQQKAAGGLTGIAKQLEGMAEIADKFGEAGITSELVRQVSGRMNRAGCWLEQREPEDLLDELRSWARRRPGAFLLGAAVAGVVAGRLTGGVAAAKSTSRTEQSAPDPRPAAEPVTTRPGPPLPGHVPPPDAMGESQPGATQPSGSHLPPPASVFGEEPGVNYHPGGRVQP
jgi:hypothetical protein